MILFLNKFLLLFFNISLLEILSTITYSYRILVIFIISKVVYSISKGA